MKLDRLVIANPSGNITGLVFDDVAAQDHVAVGAAIQEEYPSIEQVVFVQKRGDTYHGQMAGGEFCGNAARALGYILAGGEAAKKTFTMSGLSTPLTVESQPGRALLVMKTPIRKTIRVLEGKPIPIIHMEGISHAILFPEHLLYHPLKAQAARLDGKDAIKAVIEKLNLETLAACGILFVDNRDKKVVLTPYVFVRDTGTLYAETACASGSIAAAYIVGNNVDVIQPSGKTLHVNLKRQIGSVAVVVDGDMSIVWDGVADELFPRPKGVAIIQPLRTLQG